jgi:hypothetical protein
MWHQQTLPGPCRRDLFGRVPLRGAVLYGSSMHDTDMGTSQEPQGSIGIELG